MLFHRGLASVIWRSSSARGSTSKDVHGKGASVRHLASVPPWMSPVTDKGIQSRPEAAPRRAAPSPPPGPELQQQLEAAGLDPSRYRTARSAQSALTREANRSQQQQQQQQWAAPDGGGVADASQQPQGADGRPQPPAEVTPAQKAFLEHLGLNPAAYGTSQEAYEAISGKLSQDPVSATQARLLQALGVDPQSVKTYEEARAAIAGAQYKEEVPLLAPRMQLLGLDPSKFHHPTAVALAIQREVRARLGGPAGAGRYGGAAPRTPRAPRPPKEPKEPELPAAEVAERLMRLGVDPGRYTTEATARAALKRMENQRLLLAAAESGQFTGAAALPPTPGQLRFMGQLGVDVESCPNRALAEAAIIAARAARDAGPVADKQRERLIQLGLDPSRYSTYGEAAKAVSDFYGYRRQQYGMQPSPAPGGGQGP